MKYSIYTDGACSPNPGVGGWAAIVTENDIEIINFQEANENTTNQRMELEAAIAPLHFALEHLDPLDEIELWTDSAYLCNCFNQKWYSNWQRNGWRNAQKQPVANQDLWERLIPLFHNLPNLSICKVKGHSGDKWNEAVDKAAVNMRLSITGAAAR